MHSSLPQQVANFGYTGGSWLTRVLGWLERRMITHSRVVIVICQDLETTVRAIDPAVPTVLIENAPGSGDRPVAGSGAAVRAALGLGPDVPIALYTGTFERYQGLDLLFEATIFARRTRPDLKLVLVGGEPAQVVDARRRIDALRLGDAVVLTGQRPAEEIPAYLDAATMLVSPRSTGTNTPLKIYQYLRSGRPIVATNLRTHTQVLSPDIAFLGDATPEGYGSAMLGVLADPTAAAEVGQRAKALAETKYSDEAFIDKTRRACGLLAGDARTPAEGVA
jgi:glycosyltransferase involved in cell wall biosynthesis